MNVGWRVLLIGGTSGTGKTEVARQLGLHLGVSWFQVDTLRLVLQYSQVALPDTASTQALYFFTKPAVWQKPSEVLSEALIAVGQALIPSLEITIANHIDTIAPLILEGDGILPELLERPLLQRYMTEGYLRVVFLVEEQEEWLCENIARRGRGTNDLSEDELRTEARAKWLYGQWLAREAHRRNMPVVASRPWKTLGERILSTC